MEGWLEKKSNWLKEWRPRYFTLKGRELHYKEEVTSTNEKGQCTIFTAQFPPPSTAKAPLTDFSFVVFTSSKEEWHLRTGSNNDLEKWRAAVTGALDAAGREAFVTRPRASTMATVHNNSNNNSGGGGGNHAVVVNNGHLTDAGAISSNNNSSGRPEGAEAGRKRRGSSSSGGGGGADRNNTPTNHLHDGSGGGGGGDAHHHHSSDHHHDATHDQDDTGDGTNQHDDDDGGDKYWIVHKRSEWLHQWRLRVVTIPPTTTTTTEPAAAAAAAAAEPGTLLYAPVDSQTASPATVAAALKKSSSDKKLSLLSVDPFKDELLCKVITKAGEEFPLRFHTVNANRAFATAAWASLAAAASPSSSPGGSSSVKNQFQVLPSPFVENNSGNNNSGSSDSPTSASSSAVSLSCLAASGSCSGILPHASSPTAIFFGGLDCSSSNSSSNKKGGGGGPFSQNDLVPAPHGDGARAESSFVANSGICLCHLSGEHVHELFTTTSQSKQNSSQQQQQQQRPPVREGAGSCILPLGRDAALFVIQGGWNPQQGVLDDLWVLPILSSSSSASGGAGAASATPSSSSGMMMSWKQPMIVGGGGQPLLPRFGHAMVPIPARNSVILVGGVGIAGGRGGSHHHYSNQNNNNNQNQFSLKSEVYEVKFDRASNGSEVQLDMLPVGLTKPRARHAVCVVNDTWVIVVGGIVAASAGTAAAAAAAASEPSRVMEVISLASIAEEEAAAAKARGGTSPTAAAADTTTSPASSTTKAFSTLPALLPCTMHNPALCAHPTKSEFFVFGDGQLLHGVLKSAGSTTSTTTATTTTNQLPSVILSKIDYGGGTIPRSKLGMTMFAVAKYNRVFLYVFGDGTSWSSISSSSSSSSSSQPHHTATSGVMYRILVE